METEVRDREVHDMGTEFATNTPALYRKPALKRLQRPKLSPIL